ncbi:MAG TPA: hypothetical protein IAA23_00920 [Candidatus Helicobacter avistercoris]|nr:hypothetical protein [Candidatus Helicobacter avistercoris]
MFEFFIFFGIALILVALFNPPKAQQKIKTSQSTFTHLFANLKNTQWIKTEFLTKISYD